MALSSVRLSRCYTILIEDGKIFCSLAWHAISALTQQPPIIIIIIAIAVVMNRYAENLLSLAGREFASGGNYYELKIVILAREAVGEENLKIACIHFRQCKSNNNKKRLGKASG